MDRDEYKSRMREARTLLTQLRAQQTQHATHERAVQIEALLRYMVQLIPLPREGLGT
jgi:hypothetical protein